MLIRPPDQKKILAIRTDIFRCHRVRPHQRWHEHWKVIWFWKFIAVLCPLTRFIHSVSGHLVCVCESKQCVCMHKYWNSGYGLHAVQPVQLKSSNGQNNDINTRGSKDVSLESHVDIRQIYIKNIWRPQGHSFIPVWIIWKSFSIFTQVTLTTEYNSMSHANSSGVN